MKIEGKNLSQDKTGKRECNLGSDTPFKTTGKKDTAQSVNCSTGNPIFSYYLTCDIKLVVNIIKSKASKFPKTHL